MKNESGVKKVYDKKGISFCLIKKMRKFAECIYTSILFI